MAAFGGKSSSVRAHSDYWYIFVDLSRVQENTTPDNVVANSARCFFHRTRLIIRATARYS